MIQYELNSNNQPIGIKIQNWSIPKFPAKSVMDGKFCKLEPLDSEIHSKELYKANSLDKNGECWTYLPYGPFKTFIEYQNWIREMQNLVDPTFYAIIDKNTSKPVGVVSYLRIDQEKGSIEVGHLNFSNLLKRTKAATEAMYLMMNYAFELGFRRYEWKCNSLNIPSRKAAQRYGFSYEGTFRQYAINKGRNRDTAWYSIINSEWNLIQEAFEKWLDSKNFDENGQQKISLSSLTESLLAQKDHFILIK
ncbi:GNAT family N-acetyltransferase [Leptospira interrogans]|uniref:GNAT family N-acetyltransferase n=1 Tax=Leptospira interrogans TaxID=173 RepID=UPI000292962B|nr:GNAT family protein [Leptospira interrogans]ASV06413.1 N-acetyltransferase [Leptospira interrogans serovar Canicola]EKO68940.1 acetyltransferase (GNAT) domain protein [Leptospira interrogans serovar Canicola str. Fiocruz LV133]EMK19872.1 acetyltransferase (GNAT) domain protein [Leptospira interrogans str. Kito]EMN77256.1 acetyltransferase (GNAT) domain protein [Leptospira interrogans str. UI 09600]EMO00031.1 acetyltransferase (GNAT) domain protein [Leptospira interrogans serovar Pomona str.